jgi:hypothetical protein
MLKLLVFYIGGNFLFVVPTVAHGKAVNDNLVVHQGMTAKANELQGGFFDPNQGNVCVLLKLECYLSFA